MTFKDTRRAIKKRVWSIFMCTEMIFRRKEAELFRRAEYRLVKPNVKFKNIHKGKRCFILGNGPSLKKVDFASLRDEITFTVNQSPRMNDFPKLHTNYHIWTDEVFFNEDFTTPEGKELMAVMKGVNTPGNRPVVFYKTSARKMILENRLEDELDISYIMEGFTFRDAGLDLPIDRVISRFFTCVQYLILTAVYMGFSEIYLLGCDCTGILTAIRAVMDSDEQMEYAYDCDKKEKSRLKKQYTSYMELNFRNYSYIFRDYKMVNEYCKRRGVKLFNATRGGILEGVERVSLEDVLKKEKPR